MVLLRPHPFNLLTARVIKRNGGLQNCLSGYYVCLSRDLLLMSSGADIHTHTYTNVRGQNNFKKPGARRPACA